MNPKNHQRVLFPGRHGNAFGFRGVWVHDIRRLVQYQYIEDATGPEQWVNRRPSIHSRKPTVRPD